MAGPLSRYLMEFGPDGTAEVREPRPPTIQSMLAQPPVEEKIDVARQIEERLRREMKANAERELNAALAAERARFEERLAAEREKWAREQAECLASQFTAAFGNLEKQVLDSVGHILAPFLSDLIRRQAIEELGQILKLLLSEKESGTVRVNGPQDLLSELMSRLGESGLSIEYVVSDAPDVSIISNSTVIETQLNAWTSRITEAVQSSR